MQKRQRDAAFFISNEMKLMPGSLLERRLGEAAKLA